MNMKRNERNKSVPIRPISGMVPVNKAAWLTVTANEDEISITGYSNEHAAKNLLNDVFQKALPEELSIEYLESTYEGMREYMAEGRYVDRDDFEEISQKYQDAKNRSFNYGDAYTNGSYAFYSPTRIKIIDGHKTKICEFGMIGNVYKREDIEGRYIVFWHDESEIYRKGFETKEAARTKLREVFASAVPAKLLELPGFMERIRKMDIDESDMGLMEDTAFCVLPNCVFSAVIEDIV